MKRLSLLTALAALMTVGAAWAQPPAGPQLGNPASLRCIESGGMVRIETRPDGGQYGICVFADNRQCEEWAMFRGQCPAGGLRITGYVTRPARYCAITGGRYAVVANSGTEHEQGACTLPSGTVCDAGAYFAGRCGP
ncbi:MAG: DUF333 domain-containing protein [Pseudomonadota bacterium]